ncbi:hypothetical protein APHAL10511_001020 [Amanita phalloides]|nr:hypothetical protein APHAL10511_001020 [Amanita phalloides]
MVRTIKGNTRSSKTNHKGKTEINRTGGHHDIASAVHSHQQKQAVRMSTRGIEIQERRKSIYARARMRAGVVSTSGLTYIEDMQANLRRLREEESSFRSFAADYATLKRPQEDATRTIPELCNELVNMLGSRRTSHINSASEIVCRAPDARQEALKSALKHARKELERVRENEKVASDATEFIKHYKGLMMTSSDG